MVRMVLAAEYRRKGIGKLMMEFALAYAQYELKCDSIWVRTGSILFAACRLYEKYGFKETSREREGDLGDGAVDTWWTITMEKELDHQSYWQLGNCDDSYKGKY